VWGRHGAPRVRRARGRHAAPRIEAVPGACGVTGWPCQARPCGRGGAQARAGSSWCSRLPRSWRWFQVCARARTGCCCRRCVCCCGVWRCLAPRRPLRRLPWRQQLGWRPRLLPAPRAFRAPRRGARQGRPSLRPLHDGVTRRPCLRGRCRPRPSALRRAPREAAPAAPRRR